MSPRMDSQRPKFPLAVFAIIICLAAGIRLYTVFSESLSGDEFYQRLVISQPYLQQIPSLRGDIVHPPFSYWLAKAVSSVAGYRQFGLRLPAAIFGILTVALAVLLGMRLFHDNRVALSAGLLVALSDPQIVISHYARGYALLTAMVLAYVLALESALRSNERRGPWWILAGLSLILVYTHYLAWLYLIALFPVVLIRGSRKAVARWATTMAATALGALPWTIYVLRPLKTAGGLHTVLAWIKPPTLRKLAELYARFTGPAGSSVWIIVSCSVALICLTAAALAGRSGGPSSPAKSDPASGPQTPWALWFLAFVPPILLFVLAVPLRQPVWGIRHLVPVQAAWALLLGYGAAHLAPRKRLVLPAAVLVLAGLQLYQSSDALLHYWFAPFAPVARVLRIWGRPTPTAPLFAMDLRHSQIMGFYLGDEKNCFWLQTGDEPLPRTFFLVYPPNMEAYSIRLQKVLNAGYRIKWSRNFSKRPGDPQGLRLAFLVYKANPPTAYRPGSPGPSAGSALDNSAAALRVLDFVGGGAHLIARKERRGGV